MSTEVPDTSGPRPQRVGGQMHEAGFSLVEMMISVVLTGLIGAAIVGVFMDQSGFYQENSRLVTANRSLRGTASQLSTELRMVHQGDVLTAESDRLTVRYGVMHGTVCHSTSSTAYVYLHRVPESGPSTIRYMEPQNDAPRYDGTWQTGLTWSGLQPDGAQTCASHGSPAGKSSDRYREITSLSTPPRAGTLIYGTNPVTYEFDTRDGEIALVRNSRLLARPFEQSGQYLRYFEQDGTELSAPVTGGDRDDIHYVRIDATAQGHDPNQRYEGDRAISLRIPFRN